MWNNQVFMIFKILYVLSTVVYTGIKISTDILEC